MTGRRRLLGLAAALWAVPILGAAPAAAQDGPTDKVRVVASFSVLADMARVVGGDAVEVASLVGTDADAHMFQPAPAHVRAVSQAQLVVVNGHGFEGWMTRLIRSANYKGPVVTASAGVPTLGMGKDAAHGPGHGNAKARSGHSHGHAHSHASADPHIWQDPQRAQAMVRNIADGLAKVAPARADRFRANAEAYAQELARIEAWGQEQLAAVPPDRRRVVTSHDSFGYLGDRFGIAFVPAQGLSTDAEPTAQQVAALIRQVRQDGIRAVFVENVSNPRMIERIAAESGAVVGGRLYSDALSGPGGPAPSHAAMLRHNIGAIVAALKR